MFHANQLELLMSLPIFSKWSKWMVTKILKLFTKQKYIMDQIVYNCGEKFDYIYIVSSGEFEVHLSSLFQEY